MQDRNDSNIDADEVRERMRDAVERIRKKFSETAPLDQEVEEPELAKKEE